MILTTNTPYPSRKIRCIRACTHQRPQRKLDQYAVSSEDQYAVNLVNGKNSYELKGKFLDDLHNNAFSGTNGKDAETLSRILSLGRMESPDFNILFDQEYSKGRVAETMAETMEQYMSKNRADYGSGVARPKIEDKDYFELKGQFLKELRAKNHLRLVDDANVAIKKWLVNTLNKWHNGTSRSRRCTDILADWAAYKHNSIILEERSRK
ncbi:hypothetical protein Tco_0950610 [Tanacetum coccineum]